MARSGSGDIGLGQQFLVLVLGSGSRINRAIEIGGPLGPVFSVMMGERIASSFVPLLDGLANCAEANASA